MRFKLMDMKEKKEEDHKCFLCGKKATHKEISVNLYFCKECPNKLEYVYNLMKLFQG